MTEIDYSKVDWSGFVLDGFSAEFVKFLNEVNIKNEIGRPVARKKPSERDAPWHILSIEIDSARKAIQAADAADEYAKAWHEKHNVTRVEVSRRLLKGVDGVSIYVAYPSGTTMKNAILNATPGDIEIIVSRLEKA